MNELFYFINGLLVKIDRYFDTPSHIHKSPFINFLHTIFFLVCFFGGFFLFFCFIPGTFPVAWFITLILIITLAMLYMLYYLKVLNKYGSWNLSDSYEMLLNKERAYQNADNKYLQFIVLMGSAALMGFLIIHNTDFFADTEFFAENDAFYLLYGLLAFSYFIIHIPIRSEIKTIDKLRIQKYAMEREMKDHKELSGS